MSGAGVGVAVGRAEVQLEAIPLVGDEVGITIGSLTLRDLH